MSHFGESRSSEDLFLELANDEEEEGGRPPSRGDGVASRLTLADKRRSLPAVDVYATSSADRRPRSSGQPFSGVAVPQRFDAFTSDLQRNNDRPYITPSRTSFLPDDVVSTSGQSKSGRAQRYSVAQDRSPMSPSLLADRTRSPDLPRYGRRRPSFGATSSQPQRSQISHLSSVPQDSQSESPADSSDRKQSLADSASVESQTAASTVWDELDDLKSRIKKLELTGKLPSTSAAAVSTEPTERPRTATTAPTTIGSSPKVDKKREKKEDAGSPLADASIESAVGGASTSNIHPLLHSALAKAKPLLNPSLYRILEATAVDALQLAAMTGSAGPQGTTFSAASIINGVTTADRHVRRKADTMCRNLTDLCLALCEGKHESSTVTAPPAILDTPASISPSISHLRSSLTGDDGLHRNPSRPMSRLEARRTSILGAQAGGSVGNGSHGSGEEMSASEHEQEPTPSHLNVPEIRRVARGGSRLQAARLPRYDEISGDEEPTIRPLSRARTDVGRMHSRPPGPREFHTPPQRSPSLREMLVTRRANAEAESHAASTHREKQQQQQQTSRVASLTYDSGRRRLQRDPSTPPVLEEEHGNDHPASAGGSDYDLSASASAPKRRFSSLGSSGGYGSSRRATTAADLPSRTTSLSGRRRRQVVVE